MDYPPLKYIPRPALYKPPGFSINNFLSNDFSDSNIDGKDDSDPTQVCTTTILDLNGIVWTRLHFAALKGMSFPLYLYW